MIIQYSANEEDGRDCVIGQDTNTINAKLDSQSEGTHGVVNVGGAVCVQRAVACS